MIKLDQNVDNSVLFMTNLCFKICTICSENHFSMVANALEIVKKSLVHSKAHKFFPN